MPDTFTLHGSPYSQFTFKVALLLRLCGQSFGFRYVSFRVGAHRIPEFLALSPFGQVPILQHGDRALCQSAPILEHLSRVLGRFGGADEAMRQRISEFLFWDADRLGPPVYRSHGFELGRRGLLPRSAHPAVVAHYRELAEAAFAVLDGKLAGRGFLVGDVPTIADIACYGEVAFAPLAGLDIGTFRNIRSWEERISKLPGYKPPLELLPMENAEIL
ncbi:MAG TPA: glutathione S-transferase family protein [Stellaceae bacterium]